MSIRRFIWWAITGIFLIVVTGWLNVALMLLAFLVWVLALNADLNAQIELHHYNNQESKS